MSKFLLISLIFLAISNCSGQDQNSKDSILSLHPIPIESLLASSDTIHHKSFNFKFLIKVLPDNFWYLKLKKNGTYQYIHWSGWGDSDGDVIEEGKYVIDHNQLLLTSRNQDSQLAGYKLYLFTSVSNNIDNNFNIDCVERKSRVYCLYRL
ncbi:MAG: hypothetical protein ACKVOK_00165 [Flavobacteriales bacterium]